ncbi:RNA polymerase sigma factor [Actinomadura oligospora]|uniref:RNA polymerase sigma factor n=1 Tax=Actinomadura oligospora TaxID=111804 RepID=UPI00047EE776|nr:DUF6596 domain-containing protein [Actinomadura oligospora]
MSGRDVEDLLRECAPRVLGALVRKHGMFDACEDAVQEALLSAALKWPEEGVPDNPGGWLLTVASRRLVDEIRSDEARRRREDARAAAEPEPAPDPVLDRDDSLLLLFMCCHPSLSQPSRVALTLRAVGGLTTAQIAAAFLVPEATMAQRISRAKQSLKASGMPPDAERAARLAEVRHVLYLIFSEGYTSSGGPDLTAPGLSSEAIRLARMLHGLVPDDTETAGLLALMLLTDARRRARTSPSGELVPLDEQDRALWDGDLIAEGVDLVSRTLPRGDVGPYQLQAAIAAVHDEAESPDATDWAQILALYDLLALADPDNPMVSLNRAVAVAEIQGPDEALALLDALERDKRLKDHHRLLAARAHLLELQGRTAEAAETYRAAARRTSSAPEHRHLTRRADRLRT